MKKCFKCEDAATSCIEKETLEETEKLLQLHSYETSDLIHQYYLERLREQKSLSDTKYGLLTVRCGFTDDNYLEVSKIDKISLQCTLSNQMPFYPFVTQIEILNARQLMPISRDGSCDPFIRIQFSPEEKFGSTVKYKSNFQNKTLCPLFDEKFAM